MIRMPKIRSGKMRPFDLLVEGTTELKRKNYDKALQIFNKVLLVAPRDSKAYTGALMDLGLTYFLDGQYERAIENYEQYLDIMPGDDWVRNKLVEVYLIQENFDSAKKELSTILDNNPNDLEAMLSLGRVYSGFEEWDNAIAQYKSVIEQGTQIKPKVGWGSLLKINPISRGKNSTERGSEISQQNSEKHTINLAYIGLSIAYYKKEQYSKMLKTKFNYLFFNKKQSLKNFLNRLKP
jgi:tetratricopeptide (TPR) repeat protein